MLVRCDISKGCIMVSIVLDHRYVCMHNVDVNSRIHMYGCIAGFLDIME
jgi:hypothetical protein